MSSILYLGLEMPSHLYRKDVIHCPLIRISARPKEDVDVKSAMRDFALYTHLIFTSRSSVDIFFKYAPFFGISAQEIQKKCIVVVGESTSAKVRQFGASTSFVAVNETSEGVIEILEQRRLHTAHFFWPHSARSRPLISQWLDSQGIKCCSCIFYDTEFVKPELLPDLARCSEIVFTSPSTIDAFIECYGQLPNDKKLSCKGPVTEKYLRTCQICYNRSE